MSSAATAADEAETMASNGDSESAFQEIAAGTATGWGIDRGESVGTGGLAAGEDLDEVAEGDYWRQNFRAAPYYQTGTRTNTTSRVPVRLAEALEAEYEVAISTTSSRSSNDRGTRSTARNAQEWEEAREMVRDGWHRARERSG